jgi:threonine aldolase
LVTLENTISGRVLSRAYLESVLALAARRGLGTHLDGARIFNAAVKLGMPVADLCRGFDTVSACLSKGLGAPAGTLLVGRSDLIKSARRWRKMLGGGMRQAGVLAAAGLYAFDHHIERLAQDHDNAQRLAAALSKVDALKVDAAQTNMVFVDVPPAHVEALGAWLQEHRVLALIRPRTRLVTHLDVNREQVDAAVDAFAAYFARAG